MRPIDINQGALFRRPSVAAWGRPLQLIRTLLLVVALCGTGLGALRRQGVRRAVAAGPSYAITALGASGDLTSQANAINAAGQVVGYSDVNDTVSYAFLWSSTTGMVGLGTLPGYATSIAYDINGTGQVVGTANNATGMLQHAFLWSAGTGMQDLNALIPSGTGWVLLAAYAINGAGQIVGLGTHNGQQHAFLLSAPGAPPTDLGTLPGYATSIAYDINGTGQVVGHAYLNSSAYRPFLWSAGTMSDLGTLGGTNGEAFAIDGSGQVVGSADTAGGAVHAFRTAPNSAINPATDDLGTLGGSFSEAFGINTAGQVVGDAYTSSGADHAFLWSGGTMTDLGTLGATGIATGINATGQVAGYTTNTDGTDHAFLYSAGATTSLGALPGDTSSAANGLNAAGQVVGYSTNSGSAVRQAFVWSAATGMTGLGALGGTSSEARGINTAGQVVGDAATSGDAATHAALWGAPGAPPIDLGTLGGSNSDAHAINDSGQIAGDSDIAGDAATHAALWGAPGALPTDLGTLGGTDSFALAINAGGQVVGDALTPGDAQDHAYLYSGGVMTDLGTLLGGTRSIALGINTAGQVVGYSTTGSGAEHAFVWSAGTGMQDLNTLIPSGSGWVLNQATGINDNGQIVGFGTLLGATFAYLLTPQGAGTTQTITFGPLVGKTYGDPTFTVSATASSGLPVAFSASPDAVCTIAGSTVTIRGVGTCTVTASQGGNATYSPATPVSQSFSVAPAALTITASSPTVTYSGSLPPITPSYSGFVYGDTAASLTTPPTCSAVAPSTGPVGTYTTTCSGAVAANYTITYMNGTLTITKANQTISFGPLANKVYGSAPFTVSATASSGLPVGFSASGNCTVAGNTVTIIGAGSCTVTASQPGDSNYAAAPDVPQTFSIGKATPIISWSNPADIVYGTALGATQLDATASVPGTFAYTPPAGTVLHAGGGQTLSVTFTPTDTADYNSASASVTINVTRAPLTVTASNQSMVYGGAVPALTATYSGFVNGDTAASLGGALSCTTTATAASPVGTYPISCSGLTSSDYSIAYVNGTLTITKATATLALSNLNQTYDGSPKQVTVTTAPAGLSGVSVTYNGSATAPTNAGSYSVVAALSNPNYQAANATGTLTIARAATTTSLTSSRNPSKLNQPITFTATIVSGAGTPGGSVTFLDGGATLGTATLKAGVATFSAKGLGRGTHNITATYAGSPNFGGSTSAVLVQTVS